MFRPQPVEQKPQITWSSRPACRRAGTWPRPKLPGSQQQLARQRPRRAACNSVARERADPAGHAVGHQAEPPGIRGGATAREEQVALEQLAGDAAVTKRAPRSPATTELEACCFGNAGERPAAAPAQPAGDAQRRSAASVDRRQVAREQQRRALQRRACGLVSRWREDGDLPARASPRSRPPAARGTGRTPRCGRAPPSPRCGRRRGQRASSQHRRDAQHRRASAKNSERRARPAPALAARDDVDHHRAEHARQRRRRPRASRALDRGRADADAGIGRARRDRSTPRTPAYSDAQPGEHAEGQDLAAQPRVRSPSTARNAYSGRPR